MALRARLPTDHQEGGVRVHVQMKLKTLFYLGPWQYNNSVISGVGYACLELRTFTHKNSVGST